MQRPSEENELDPFWELKKKSSRDGWSIESKGGSGLRREARSCRASCCSKAWQGFILINGKLMKPSEQ